MSTPNTVKPSNYGPILPVTMTKADAVLNAAAKAGHKIVRVYGYNSIPDHNNLRCIDFMHDGDRATREWIENYLIKNANRLGAEGMISNHKVMDLSPDAAYRPPLFGWRTYTGSNPHTDHVHVQFDTAPIKRTILKPAPARPKPVRPNFTAAAAALSRAIAANKPGTPAHVAASKALAGIKEFVK